MNPCLINVYSPRDEDVPFFKSLEPFKDSFEHEVVELPHYPGNLARFFLIPEITSDDNWYIFTDTSDVRMQAAIPDLKDIKGSIIVANEHEIHKNSWWAPHIEGQFNSLANKTIYNAGAFAMKGSMFKKFLRLLESYGRDNPPYFTDQLAFNIFCQQHIDQVVEHPTLFLTLYANLQKGLTLKVGEQWLNSQQKPYVFVHGNGSTKMFL